MVLGFFFEGLDLPEKPCDKSDWDCEIIHIKGDISTAYTCT